MQCAAGTIWDQVLPGCNHPWAVVKPHPVGCSDPEGLSVSGVAGGEFSSSEEEDDDEESF